MLCAQHHVVAGVLATTALNMRFSNQSRSGSPPGSPHLTSATTFMVERRMQLSQLECHPHHLCACSTSIEVKLAKDWLELNSSMAQNAMQCQHVLHNTCLSAKHRLASLGALRQQLKCCLQPRLQWTRGLHLKAGKLLRPTPPCQPQK